MKIKLSLFFTILFCSIMQDGLCTDQNINVQTVQDTGIIHTTNDNSNITNNDLQEIVDNNAYVNSGDMDIQINNDFNNDIISQDLNNSIIDSNEAEDSIIIDNVTSDVSSNNGLNNMSNENIIIIDDGTNYNNDFVDEETFLDDEIPDNDNIANNDTVVTAQQEQLVQNNNTTQNNTQNSTTTQNNIQNTTTTQNNTQNNEIMQNNTPQNNNLNNNTANSDTTTAEADKSVKKIDRVYVSLMFTEENIQDIFKALPASSTGIPDQYSLGFNGDQNGENDINKTTNLSIYLNSVMYISDNAWSLWLNGNKITNMSKNTGDIEVVKVTPLYVDFVWKVSDLQWQAINKNNLIPSSNYKVNGDYVDLYFTLSPNQTYIPALNQILEGNQRQIPANNQAEGGNTTQEDTAVVNAQTEELFF